MSLGIIEYPPYRTHPRTRRRSCISPNWVGKRFPWLQASPRRQLGNLYRPGLSHGLTCGEGCPGVTVRHRSLPRLMARRTVVRPAPMAGPCSSPVLLDSPLRSCPTPRPVLVVITATGPAPGHRPRPSLCPSFSLTRLVPDLTADGLSESRWPSDFCSGRQKRQPCECGCGRLSSPLRILRLCLESSSARSGKES